MWQHAIDNFKLIAEIHVLASETFKTILCWERSKKKLRVKKHRSASKPLHNCRNGFDVSFFNNDYAYMYLYFCMRWWLQLFCSQLQILERRNFVSWKRNFVSSKRYFVSPKRNFAAFSSEAKVRNLIAEIRVNSLISANFVCISFAQYCTTLSLLSCIFGMLASRI